MRIRPERVAQRIQREVAEMLEHKMRDPRISRWVSVTDCQVNHDLSFARVYVSVLAEGDERERTLAALHKAEGWVRHELAGRLELREVPEIRFLFDPSLEHGARVDELLRKIERGETVDDEEDEQ